MSRFNVFFIMILKTNFTHLRGKMFSDQLVPTEFHYGTPMSDRIKGQAN